MPFDANDPDTKAAIKVITDKLSTEFETRIEAIDAKKQEALDEAKKAKAELRKTQEIKPEDVAALEADNDKLKVDLVTANKAVKEATAAAEKATKALETEQGVTHKLVAESGLRELLLKGGVTDPDFLDMAVGKYLPGVKVEPDGDGRKAMYGDKELSAFVTGLLASDAGKKIVTAANNSGGGASGGSGKGSGKTITQEAFNEMSPKDRSSFFSDGGVIAQAA